MDKISDSVLDVTLESLSFLICSAREQRYQPSIHRLQAADFDGFEPLTDENTCDDGVLIGNDPSDQPIWPVDISIAGLAREDWPVGSWQFTRYGTLKTKEWRGLITKYYPRMFDYRTMIVRPDGTNVGVRVAYAIYGQKLIDVPRTTTGLRLNIPNAGIDPSWYGNSKRAKLVGDNEILVRLLGGFALRQRYNWSVLIGENTGPRARFLTDPVGLREVFRLRDIPPGAARRAALLHWVRAHWRKRRDPSADDLSWVRRHLRGALSYTWNGLSCQIEPATYDLEQLVKEYAT